MKWSSEFSNFVICMNILLTIYVKSERFKKRGWIIVKIQQEVVNIWIFPPICFRDHLYISVSSVVEF